MRTRKRHCLAVLIVMLGMSGCIGAAHTAQSSGAQLKALQLIAGVEKELNTALRVHQSNERTALEQASRKAGVVEDFFQRVGCTSCFQDLDPALEITRSSVEAAPAAETKETVSQEVADADPMEGAVVAPDPSLGSVTGADAFAQRLFKMTLDTPKGSPETTLDLVERPVPTAETGTVHRSSGGKEIEIPVQVGLHNAKVEAIEPRKTVPGAQLEFQLPVNVSAVKASDDSIAQAVIEAKKDGPKSLLIEEYQTWREMQQSLAQRVADEKYRLQIGDQLVVSIYGESGTAREVLVDALGNVSYLLVGSVRAFGLTVEELREALNDKIKKVFKHAIVNVTPSSFGGQFYTILGEVQRPGRQVLNGSITLLSAIAGSGGLRSGSYKSQTIDLADLTHAFLAREGDYVPVDFKKLIVDGDQSQDIPLRPGDYIHIPSTLQKEIYILGEVTAPTTIGYSSVVTLAEAICQARGLREDSSSSRAIIIRGSLVDPIRIEADIKRILKGFEKDILLQPGDIVYVPPRRFNTMRDWVKLGIRAFVGAAASSAGSRSFIHMHPHGGGGGTGRVQPVTVISP